LRNKWNKSWIALGSLLFANLLHAGEVNFSVLEKNLKAYEKKINSLSESIDNSIFNDSEVVLKLDFDSEKLIAFVQNNIVFQPYNGLLRGVQGTLNARAGNALDQSVLLAKLLNDAGLETKIASAELSDIQAKVLLTAFKKAKLPSNIVQATELASVLNEVKSHKQGSTKPPYEWRKTETYHRYKSTLTNLQNVLKENNLILEDTDITSKLIAENKEYFWVKYRIDNTEEWRNAHPAMPEGSKIQIQAMSHFKQSVPKKYLHQVRVEAFIQQKNGDKYITHSLMPAWQRPVVNLQNVLITFSNTPSAIGSSTEYDLAKIIDKSTYFTPKFNGHAVGNKVFDLKGRLIDAEAMNSAAGSYFQTLSDKTLTAMDFVDGKEPGESSLQLTAQWLQFTFIEPNGREYVQKRYILQTDQNEQIDPKTIKAQLLSEYQLVVNSGEKPNAYLAKVYLDLVKNGLPLLKASTKKLFGDNDKVKFPKQLYRNEFQLLSQYFWMKNNPDLGDDIVRYRNNANMLGFKKGYVNAKTAYIAVDIIANKQRFIKQKNNSYYSVPQAALAHGVWETASEWLPAKVLGIKGKDVDTIKITQAVKEQDLDFEVIAINKNSEQKVQQIFAQNAMAQQRIMADIEQNYNVIVPKTSPKGLKLSGWWRINPVTGETLGMTADGGGQSATEYMIQTAQNALMLVRALANLKKCDSKTNDFAKLCCLAEAHANNVGGMAFGGMLGGVVGTSAAAVFDIADFTVELATGSGIAPSSNGKLCAGIDFPEF